MTSKGFCIQTHRKAQERPSLRGSKGPGPADILTWHFWPREYIYLILSHSVCGTSFSSFYIFLSFFNIIYVCVHTCVSTTVYVWRSEDSWTMSVLAFTRWDQGLNSGCETWRQALHPLNHLVNSLVCVHVHVCVFTHMCACVQAGG